MDMKELSSSEDSLGSDDDYGEEGEGAGKGKEGLIGSDSLLDSTSDSDTDDDSDKIDEAGEDMEVDEDVLLAELAQINDQLAENPYAYEVYGEKIKVLKKLGDLGKLRETREKFSELYPLSESLWLEWLRDEIKLACTNEEKTEVINLFERAVGDYLSVDVWLEYINFCISNMDSEGGQARCRDVFERALGSCGLHVSMGSVIWDMYRDFEAALLGTTTNEEQLKAQENRYISLCRRQLSVPLLGMASTHEDLKAKIDIDENTESSYKKALERMEVLETWESKLIQPAYSGSEEKTRVFREYIEDEKKSKCNPARIQCLYERAVSQFPLDSSIWLEYLDYLGKNLKIESILLNVAQRASRNCSWDVSIWLKYMNTVEQFCESGNVFEVMKSVFEKAILYFGVGETAGTVWLKYLEFLRRKLDLNNPDNKQLEILKKTFVAAEEHLLQLLPEPNDYICEILLFRLRFEAQCAKSTAGNVANLWKNLLGRGYGQYAKTWIQFILQEISFGNDVKKIRSHYAKAVSYVQDEFQTISNLWVNFERDNGDLASLQQCEAKISSQMEKNAAAAAASSQQQYEYDSQMKADLMNSQKGKKRKMVDNDTSTNFSAKKERKINEDTVDSDQGGAVFKVPSLPSPKTLKNKAQAEPQENQVKGKPVASAKGSSGYTHGESVKHDPSKDNRTVFLSNLAFSTGEDEINNFFNDVGKVEEIRLAKDFKGRSKGFGYVCFSSTAEAKVALGKDRKPLEGRPAFVSKCDPDKSTRQKQFKYPTKLEKNKLFVKGLPFSLTVDELKDLFGKHGDLKDCRLVTYRNGHSKGLAYVEFVDESVAKQAILKTDGMMIGDKKISVALSNPPTRDAKSNFQSGSSLFSKSSTDLQQRRAPKAFIPRSLQVGSTASPTVKEEAADSKSSTAPKSNQDFRNMFLK